MTSGHEAEPSLRRQPRVRPVGFETVREKPQGGMGIPGDRGEINVVKQKSVQNQALKLQATGDPWKHLLPHVSLPPAEGDIGKGWGDMGNVGRKEKGCAYLDPFWECCSASRRRSWQYLICGAFMLFAFLALLACEGCVYVVFRAQRGTVYVVSALDTCWLFFISTLKSSNFSLGWLLSWASCEWQLDSCDELQQPQGKVLGVPVLDYVFWKRK